MIIMNNLLRVILKTNAFCKACRIQKHYNYQHIVIMKYVHSGAKCSEFVRKYTTECKNHEEYVYNDTSCQIFTHSPVMVKEVLDILAPKANQVFLDLTYGGGGHTKALLGCEPNLKIFALDRDPDSYERAKTDALSMPAIVPLLGTFSEVGTLLLKQDIGPGSLDGVLVDAGASSFQFDMTERGFSLSKNGPLDMRMDKDRIPNQPTAADVVNYLDESGLYKLLKKYGEEKKAKFIARAIVEQRHAFGSIKTTHHLASVVESAFVGTHKQDKLMRHSHVATKTFQALRTFVNNELNELYNGLEIAYNLLKPGGICVAITFHSLEDRVIKRLFHGINMDDKLNKTLSDHRRHSYRNEILYTESDVKRLLYKKWAPLFKKPLLPSEEEINKNPRARSAKLRAAWKKLDEECS